MEEGGYRCCRQPPPIHSKPEILGLVLSLRVQDRTTCPPNHTASLSGSGPEQGAITMEVIIRLTFDEIPTVKDILDYVNQLDEDLDFEIIPEEEMRP